MTKKSNWVLPVVLMGFVVLSAPLSAATSHTYGPTDDPLFGFRVGINSSGLALIGDASGFKFKRGSANFSTRLSLGLIDYGNILSGIQIDEIAAFPTAPDVNLYIGAGVNLPFMTDNRFGVRVFGGVDKNISLFALNNEAVFLEAGLTTFTRGLPRDTTSFDAMLGYKFSF